MNPKPVPPWHTVRDAVRLIASGVTFRTSARISAVVGTLLSVVNQGAVIAAGHAGRATWIRVAVNYVVPYIVSSIGYLAPFRTSKSPRHDVP